MTSDWIGPDGTLELPPDATAHQVDDAVRLAFAAGAARVECRIPADAYGRRRLLHRIGFRREGRLRAALARPDGSRGDLDLYARLPGEDLGPATFSTVMNTVLNKTRVIAHALLRDEAGRILLLETSYKRDWELPGGVVDPHESPRTGAEREITEELGIQVRLGQPLLVDWMPPYLGWDDAVEFIFDGGVLPAEQVSRFVLADGEILAAHWVRSEDAAGHIYALSARRLAWVLANPGHPTQFFEDGNPA